MMAENITSPIARRMFLRLLAGASATAVATALAACGSTNSPTATVTIVTSPVSGGQATPAPQASSGVATPASQAAGSAISGQVTPAPQAAGGAIKRGGTLRYAPGKAWPTLDPHLVSTTFTPLQHLYDSLFSLELADPKTGRHEVKGALAESWDTSNPTAIVLKLRQGVKFHDGTDWNADVAKWNLDRIRTTKQGQAYLFAQPITGVDVLDAFTIKLNVAGPTPGLLVGLSNGPTPGASMISRTAFEKAGADGFTNKAAGTGPFQLVENVQDSHATLKRFDGYWRKDASGQQLPYLDGIVFQITLDATVALTALRAGTIDVLRGVQPQDLKGVQADANLVYQPLTGYQGLIGTHGYNLTTGPFKDKRVRQAGEFALDRKVFADTLGFGFATPWQVPVWTPANLGWDDSLNTMYATNVDKAKQLLADAGYAKGFDATFIFQARQPDQRIGEIMQQMWGEIGIRLKLDPLDRLVWIDRQKKGDFDLSNWGTNTLPDPDTGKSNFVLGGAQNYSNYTNPMVDSLMNAGGATYDDKERAAKYQQALKVIIDDAGVLATYTQVNNIVYRKAFHVVTKNFFSEEYIESSLA